MTCTDRTDGSDEDHNKVSWDLNNNIFKVQLAVGNTGKPNRDLRLAQCEESVLSGRDAYPSAS